MLSYPSISSFFQQNPIRLYLKSLWANDRKKFYIAIGQYAALLIFMAVMLIIDWKKALLYILVPHQVALFTVLIFNYIQHVHADEESKYNHSRNFVSKFTNFMMFNNGLHTVHHNKSSLHWSMLPEAHNKIKHLIDPQLNQSVILFYLFRTYLVAPLAKPFHMKSMRLERKRIKAELELTTTNIPSESVL